MWIDTFYENTGAIWKAEHMKEHATERKGSPLKKLFEKLFAELFSY